MKAAISHYTNIYSAAVELGIHPMKLAAFIDAFQIEPIKFEEGDPIGQEFRERRLGPAYDGENLFKMWHDHKHELVSEPFKDLDNNRINYD